VVSSLFPLPQLRWQISAEGLDHLGRPQCHLCHQGLGVGFGVPTGQLVVGWWWLGGDHPLQEILLGITIGFAQVWRVVGVLDPSARA
jgi:hypothetical protein